VTHRRLDTPSDLPTQVPPYIVVDTETTGLDKFNDHAFLVSTTIEGKTRVLRPEDFIPWYTRYCTETRHNVFHNAKYDLHMLVNCGLPMHCVRHMPVFCTQVTETLINDRRTKYSLNAICGDRFGIKKSDDELLQWLADKFGGKPDRKSQIHRITQAPIEMVAYYAAGDTELTERLYKQQLTDILNLDLQGIHSLEMQVLPVLMALERRGVPIDEDRVRDSLVKFTGSKAAVCRQIEELVGFEVNTRSGKQLENAFTSLGYGVQYNKDTGNPTFNKEVLESLDDELSKLILDERSYGTMINTFLSRFLIHSRNGRIHCDFNQTKTDDYGVLTGRLSASNPNLTQIPKRNKEKASQVRSVFKAPKGAKWISADWKQFEFRMFAHYSNDPLLVGEFNANPEADYHQMIADLTGLKRNPYAKQLNLGLVFGMGMGLMAKKCGLPYTQKTMDDKIVYVAGAEAKKVFGQYHDKLPGVQAMLKKAERVATVRGYIRTMSGRRITFKNKNQTYKAGGYVFQGSSADVMKQKLVRFEREFGGSDDVQLILPVHDEFNFVDYTGNSDRTMEIITEIMNDVPNLRVPVRCDVKADIDWWEASK
jgi:DNA polymerase I